MSNADPGLSLDDQRAAYSHQANLLHSCSFHGKCRHNRRGGLFVSELLAVGIAVGFILGVLFTRANAAAASRSSSDATIPVVPRATIGTSQSSVPAASAVGRASRTGEQGPSDGLGSPDSSGGVPPFPTAGTVAPLCSPSPCPTLPPKPRRSIEGAASWFAAPDGQAAAGPGLRQAIGRKWRGQRVTVCGGGRCVSTVLSDFCRCPNGKVIDLDDDLFARLGDLSRGLIPVTVRW